MSYAIDAAIRTKVLACTGVSALMSTRLYSEQGPQTPTAPYAVMSMADSTGHRSLNSGALRSATAKFGLTVWATTREGASTLAGLISARSADGGIDGFRGAIDAVHVQSITVGNIFHGAEPSSSGDESLLYSATFTITVFHNT